MIHDLYVSSECRTSHYISVHGRVRFLTSLWILLPMYMYTDELYSLRLIKYNTMNILLHVYVIIIQFIWQAYFLYHELCWVLATHI